MQDLLRGSACSPRRFDEVRPDEVLGEELALCLALPQRSGENPERRVLHDDAQPAPSTNASWNPEALPLHRGESLISFTLLPPVGSGYARWSPSAYLVIAQAADAVAVGVRSCVWGSGRIVGQPRDGGRSRQSESTPFRLRPGKKKKTRGSSRQDCGPAVPPRARVRDRNAPRNAVRARPGAAGMTVEHHWRMLRARCTSLPPARARRPSRRAVFARDVTRAAKSQHGSKRLRREMCREACTYTRTIPEELLPRTA